MLRGVLVARLPMRHTDLPVRTWQRSVYDLRRARRMVPAVRRHVMTADQRYIDDLELFGGPTQTTPEPSTRGMTTGEALGLAEEWAARGVPVFPVAISWDAAKQGTSKRPLCEHGFHDATTEVRQVRLLFNTATPRTGETLGVGLHPGRANLLFVTLTASTPSGSFRGSWPAADIQGDDLSGAAHFAYRKPELVHVGTQLHLGRSRRRAIRRRVRRRARNLHAVGRVGQSRRPSHRHHRRPHRPVDGSRPSQQRRPRPVPAGRGQSSAASMLVLTTSSSPPNATRTQQHSKCSPTRGAHGPFLKRRRRCTSPGRARPAASVSRSAQRPRPRQSVLRSPGPPFEAKTAGTSSRTANSSATSTHSASDLPATKDQRGAQDEITWRAQIVDGATWLRDRQRPSPPPVGRRRRHPDGRQDSPRSSSATQAPAKRHRPTTSCSASPAATTTPPCSAGPVRPLDNDQTRPSTWRRTDRTRPGSPCCASSAAPRHGKSSSNAYGSGKDRRRPRSPNGPGLLLEMAQEADAGFVVVDSLKDMALRLSEDEVGSAINSAHQLLVANGIDVLSLHHPRKPPGRDHADSRPIIDDLYGSAWLAAGAGSVLFLAKNPTSVEATQVKSPDGIECTFRFRIDTTTGGLASGAEDEVLVAIRDAGPDGISTKDVARWRCRSASRPKPRSSRFAAGSRTRSRRHGCPNGRRKVIEVGRIMTERPQTPWDERGIGVGLHSPHATPRLHTNPVVRDPTPTPRTPRADPTRFPDPLLKGRGTWGRSRHPT